jgi:hypothetical protein
LLAAVAIAGASALYAVDKAVCKDQPYTWALQGISLALWNTTPVCVGKAETKAADHDLSQSDYAVEQVPGIGPVLTAAARQDNLAIDEAQRHEIKQPFDTAVKYPPLWMPPTVLSLPLCPYAPQCWVMETTGGAQ